MFEAIIIPAISLGLSAVSVPGPLQAYLLNITLRYGWRRGIFVVVSPLITDGPIILVTVFLLGQLDERIIQGIRIVGGLVLLWIAWGAWKQYRAGASYTDGVETEDPKRKTNISPWRVLGTASAMNLLSPGPYLFWTTVTGPLLLEALEISPLAAVGMLLGFYGTFIGGMVVLVLVFNQMGQINQRVTNIILLITIALLVWFATMLIAEALGIAAYHSMLTQMLLVVGAIIVVTRTLMARAQRTG